MLYFLDSLGEDLELPLRGMIEPISKVASRSLLDLLHFDPVEKKVFEHLPKRAMINSELSRVVPNGPWY